MPRIFLVIFLTFATGVGHLVKALITFTLSVGKGFCIGVVSVLDLPRKIALNVF